LPHTIDSFDLLAHLSNHDELLAEGKFITSFLRRLVWLDGGFNSEFAFTVAVYLAFLMAVFSDKIFKLWLTIRK